MLRKNALPTLGVALFLLFAATAAHAVLELEEIHDVRNDFDVRPGALEPSDAALTTADARWNRFGTVHVLYDPDGFLSTGLVGDAETVAREWIAAHRDLFGLSLASVEALVLERDAHFHGSSARVFLFNQVVDGVPVRHDGRIKIGLVDGHVFWVSSSSIGEAPALDSPSIDGRDAWIQAAFGLGLDVSLADLSAPTSDGSWDVFDVAGLSHPQRARPVALGVPGQGAVPAWETIVVHMADDGHLTGYTTFVDARTGERLVGQNRVQQLLEGDDGSEPVVIEAFNGSFPPNQVGTCGPCHGPFTAEAAAAWDEMNVVVHQLTGGDITFNVYRDDASCTSAPVLSQDLLTTPEQATLSPVDPGDYYVEVCPFDALTNAVTAEYAGSVTLQNSLSPNTNPKWRYFPAYPSLDFAGTDTRILGCWFDTDTDGSVLPLCDSELAAGSSHGLTWDYLPTTGTTSETTTGNAARSSEAWAAFLSGGGVYQPVVTSTDPADHRVYDFPWTNHWFEAACDPTAIAHTGGLADDVDIDAAITNLFALHNEVHAYAYHLGLREREGAAQLSNFGTTSAVEESDFELGNAQAGAISGGWPAYTGRDNANQLTLNDGIPPLSNMYLWQTIGGTIYVPCVDGDFDAGVIAHEYGHLVQNRMVDPQNGLSGDQGRAMGESWSDLTAVTFLNQYSRVPVADENPFAVGAYITDPQKGIRNFAMNESPLNYSDVGYDFVCSTDLVDGTCLGVTQVHADGEIWSATNFALREALRTKYDADFPSSDAALQKRCADGQVPSDLCPGNRRFSQIMHDAFLLMPSSPSMVDARDAYLAADRARAADPLLSWTSNEQELWDVFASRGFGAGASSAGSDDFDPVPSFESPLGGNGTFTFELVDADSRTPIAGEVFVGAFEARATPVADTDPATDLGAEHRFVAGDYDFVARADGYGHFRFSATVRAGRDDSVEVRMPRNWASAASGATAAGAGVDLGELIDDTEETNWERTGASPSVDAERPGVTVTLQGVHAVNRVQVSGMLEVFVGQGLQNRFSSLHGFRVSACNAAVSNCSLASSYSVIAEVPDAFPSSALRPLVPDTTLRSFPTAEVEATHLFFEALHNKCTGTPSYHGYLGIPGNDDGDPNNGTDCRTGSEPLIGPKNDDVRAAEFQAFGNDGQVKIRRAKAATAAAAP